MENNKDIISKLKFIGKIQNGDKLTKSMSIQSDSYITQLYRTIFQENRQKTLAFLEETINKTFEILHCYQKSKKKSEQLMCIYLVEDLKNSKSGLNNIKKTYEKDPKFCCDIDTLLQMIEAKLSEIKVYVPPPPPPTSEDEEEYDEKKDYDYEGDDL